MKKSQYSQKPQAFGTMSHRTYEQFTKTISFRGIDGTDDNEY